MHNRQWVNREDLPESEAKNNLHRKKVMLSIFWDSGGIVYWELLPRNSAIDA